MPIYTVYISQALDEKLRKASQESGLSVPRHLAAIAARDVGIPIKPIKESPGPQTEEEAAQEFYRLMSTPLTKR